MNDVPFVGGEADKTRRCVRQMLPEFKLVKPSQPFKSISEIDQSDASPTFQDITYVRERLRAGDTEFIFYRHEGTPIETAVGMMLDNYGSKKAEPKNQSSR